MINFYSYQTRPLKEYKLGLILKSKFPLKILTLARRKLKT